MRTSVMSFEQPRILTQSFHAHIHNYRPFLKKILNFSCVIVNESDAPEYPKVFIKKLNEDFHNDLGNTMYTQTIFSLPFPD